MRHKVFPHYLDRYDLYPRQWIHLPRLLYLEAKAFIERGLYGVADADVYNLDWYLDSVIANGLTNLLTKVKHVEMPRQTLYEEVIKTIEHVRALEDEELSIERWVKQDAKRAKAKKVALKKLVDVWDGMWW